ncbi:hypothetical protein BCR35DRAFT_330054 [Leucosporidium creatinivorum]|uniref:UBZ4-type domain-containing protein n=1 Tax=Leucosporidium creatinivorum TaxID=106004 RepID=A0A1Y2FWX0_9BASI|nr:hypothetical protein BCR35DRAFT_330054 [Leucosporidium creatinivorum]
MAPVDPGAAVAWAKRPAYSDSLLSQLNLLPRDDAQLLLTMQLSELTQGFSKRRVRLLKELTPKLFVAGGEAGAQKAKKEKSHEGSVSRRLQQLSTEFHRSLKTLRELQGQAKADEEASIRQTFPYYDRLHSLAADDSQYLPYHERILAEDHWRPFKARDAFYEAAEAAEAEDAMEGIEYNALQPPQPVAGPAYPQHQANPFPPNPPPAPNPQPQPPHNQAPHHHHPPPVFAPVPNSPARLAGNQANPRSPADTQPDDLTHCPTCDLPLTTLSSSAATDHLRQCLDGAGGTVMQCPVCELELGNLGATEREMHVDACCNGGVGTDKGKERAREYAEFKADTKTLPRLG